MGYLQILFCFGLLRGQAIISHQNWRLRKSDEWKVQFTPPLEIKENAKFRICFTLNYASYFSLQDNILICCITKIFKKF